MPRRDPLHLDDAGAFRVEQQFSRREVLRMGGLGGLALAVLPKFALDGGCTVTTPDIRGPFYVSGAPVRTVLAGPDEPGRRIRIAGRVLAPDCQTPLDGAVVDVWMADAEGCYSNVTDACGVGPNDFDLRGQMLTDAEGRYSFEAVKPGFYLNGSQFRPAHIHFRVVTPDGSETLITQLYFAGDPYIEDDPWASSPAAADRIIRLRLGIGPAPPPVPALPFHGRSAPAAPAAAGLPLKGRFDVVLDASDPQSLHEIEEHGAAPETYALLQNTPNPFHDRTSIRFSLPRPARALLTVHSVLGRELLRQPLGEMEAGYHRFGWDGRDALGHRVPSGTYVYRLAAEDDRGRRFSRSRRMVRIG